MAGSHRGNVQRPDRRPLLVVAVLVLGLLVAVAFAALQLAGDGDTTAAPEEPAVTPKVSVTPTPSPTLPATSTPTTPTPTTSPTPAAPSLPALRAASPRRLFVPGVLDSGFDDSIEPSGDRFTTRSTAELSRWGSRAVPASPARDTVFVAGRIAPDGDSGFGALPRVGTGAKVSLRTDAGVLTYTVRAVTTRAAAGITRSPLFTARVPGRLVLIGVRYGDGGVTGTYVVVTAQLTGVSPG